MTNLNLFTMKTIHSIFRNLSLFMATALPIMLVIVVGFYLANHDSISCQQLYYGLLAVMAYVAGTVLAMLITKGLQLHINE